MKRSEVGFAKFVAVAGISLVSCAASAGNTGPYVGLQFGINEAKDQTLQYNGTRTATNQPPIIVELPQIPNEGPAADYTYEKNVLGQAVVGYKYGFGLRPEFELSLRRERASSITNPDGSTEDPSGTRLSTVTGFFNLWYDAFPQWKVHPYAGAGIGVARLILNNPQTNVTQSLLSQPESRKSDDARYAWQFGGGLQYDIFQGVTIGIDYRYVRTTKADFYAYREQPNTFLSTRYKAQSLLFSVKYYFVDPPVAVAPPPEPTPEVVPVEPPKDDDQDGVFNDLDKCPDSPAGSVVDETGCPPAPPPPPPKTCKTPGPGEKISLAGCGTGDNIVLRGVNFDTNKATLTRNAKVLLDDVAAELNQYQDIKVQVGGHTDSRGSAALNDGLSKRRAASVMAYLTAKGIAANRMTSAGFGPNEPIADNATAEGQELNRRVELKIVSGNATPAEAQAAATEAAVDVAPDAEVAPAEDAPAAE